MISSNDPPQPAVPEPRGDGGVQTELMPAYHSARFRGNCRHLVEILQFRRDDGSPLISEREVETIVRAAIPMAAQAAKDGRARDYRAIMQVLYAGARLEQNEKPEQHVHAHVNISWEELAQRLEAIAELRGIEVPPDDDENGKP